MKYITLTLLIAFAFIPFAVSAHGVETPNIDGELHEEMEGLMGKMMTGELSGDETDQMISFMNEYPEYGPGMMTEIITGEEYSMMPHSGFGYSYMTDRGMGGYTGGFLMILVWLLIFVGIGALLRYIMKGSLSSRSSDDALEILKERYARGEIDKDEFEEKSRELK